MVFCKLDIYDFSFVDMATRYKRRAGAENRRQWTQENLVEALGRIEARKMSVNEAARNCGIPSRTLHRRKQTEDIPPGPRCILGIKNKKRLVNHSNSGEGRFCSRSRY